MSELANKFGSEGYGASAEEIRCKAGGTKRRILRRGKANKSARGMPWHQEPTKDVISCDKLRGAANER